MRRVHRPLLLRQAAKLALIELFSADVVFAYARKRLFNAYTGPLYKVRRSSDNAELDIYSDATNAENATVLLGFVGAGNGFVSLWCDQSGAALHLPQADLTKQPPIVSAGSILSTIQWDGVNQFVQSSGNVANCATGLTLYYSGIPIAATGSGTPVAIHLSGTNEAFVSFNLTSSKLQPIATGSGVLDEAGGTDSCRALRIDLAQASFSAQVVSRVTGATSALTTLNNTPSSSPLGGGKLTIGNTLPLTNPCKTSLRAVVGYNAVHSLATMDALNALLT